MALDNTVTELIVTAVSQETHDGVTYPITAVRRYEFESPEKMLEALELLQNASGVVDYQALT